jgi:hypothetical protein
MDNSDGIDDPRRLWLIQALAAGLFAGGLDHAIGAGLFGSKPTKLPPGQSIFSLSGEVMVNDQSATLSSSIKPGDTVQTAKNSELVFVVGSQAMILRGDSKLVIEAPDNSPGAFIIAGLRMLTGKLLSVSRDSPMAIRTATATIGIRGTGFYVEADPELTYFCTCYGSTEVQSNQDPDSKESITATHHDRPVYVGTQEGRGRNIRNAPFLDHSDQELSLIETLVGRRTPFVFSKDAYTAPRRGY